MADRWPWAVLGMLTGALGGAFGALLLVRLAEDRYEREQSQGRVSAAATNT